VTEGGDGIEIAGSRRGEPRGEEGDSGKDEDDRCFVAKGPGELGGMVNCAGEARR
jgi:hypothetical protein